MNINSKIYESYSLNEAKTNKTWIDGKPIYIKTIYKENVTSQRETINLHTLNIDRILNAYGSAVRTSNPNIKLPLPMTYSNWEIWLYDYNNANYDGEGSVSLNMNNNQFNAGLKDLYITIEYTKTTDEVSIGQIE